MADVGMTVPEIKEKLEFPTSAERISQMVWDHFVATGKILLEKPEPSKSFQKVSYVKETGPYGKVSFKQVSEEVPASGKTYLPCNFGKEIYKDKKAFLKKISVLSKRDQDYLLSLPWTLTTVWHEADERMSRIHRLLFPSSVTLHSGK
ncbi:MAG: hypothetical protein IJV66_06555 [Firmicutes bacterium]|nr:hypothetical protein [Bacillota bacterium]